MDFKKIFAKRLREIRKDRGLSQDDLAKICDLKKSYVSQLEQGSINVTIDTASKIADALGVGPQHLFEVYYSDPMTGKSSVNYPPSKVLASEINQNSLDIIEGLREVIRLLVSEKGYVPESPMAKAIEGVLSLSENELTSVLRHLSSFPNATKSKMPDDALSSPAARSYKRNAP